MPTISLNLPETTFVASGMPDNNFSFYPVINTGFDPNFEDCIGLLQVDLSSLPVNEVDSAKLELAVILKTGETPSNILVNRVTEAFDTTTVTYSTIPAYIATQSQMDVTASDLYTTVQIDVTEIINSWLNGTYANYGFALTNSDGTTNVQFATNNIIYEPYFPKLTVTYSSSPVQDSALCFSFAQLAHIIQQIITYYPTNVITVFTVGLTGSSVTGTPYQLYSSPDGTFGSIFILMDSGQQEAIPLNAITAIYTGDGTVYNPSITYLNAPEFPAGCDTNLLKAYYSYLPLQTVVDIYSGSNIHASGMVYKNEYGIIVLSDTDGNTPVFIPVFNINILLPQPQTGLKEAVPPQIKTENNTGIK